jgi:hypothetical protein
MESYLAFYCGGLFNDAANIWTRQFYPVVTKVSFPGRKATGERSRPLRLIITCEKRWKNSHFPSIRRSTNDS